MRSVFLVFLMLACQANADEVAKNENHFDGEPTKDAVWSWALDTSGDLFVVTPVDYGICLWNRVCPIQHWGTRDFAYAIKEAIELSKYDPGHPLDPATNARFAADREVARAAAVRFNDDFQHDLVWQAVISDKDHKAYRVERYRYKTKDEAIQDAISWWRQKHGG